MALHKRIHLEHPLSVLRTYSKLFRVLPRLIAPLVLSACGPTVTVKLPKGVSVPSMIAVLPADYSNDIARERVDYVRSSLIAELRNKNFIILDDKTVNSLCSTADCPERSAIANSYPVGAFISFKLDSLSRNNFIAGYFNVLSGELAVIRPDNTEIFKVEHSERERGGLLFNSGQLFQGIISQVKNSGDSAFNYLATRFVRTLIAQVPEAVPINSDAVQGSATPIIENAELISNKNSVTEVCTRGTARTIASVTMGKIKSGLREVSPGNYCASFPSETVALAPKPLLVELRNAFGTATRKEISGIEYFPCNLEDRVTVASTTRENQLSIACSSLPGGSGSCPKGAKMCSIAKAVIYRGFGPIGPYIKVAESKSAVWKDRVTMKYGQAARYQVVSIDEKGVRSLPVAAIPQN